MSATTFQYNTIQPISLTRIAHPACQYDTVPVSFECPLVKVIVSWSEFEAYYWSSAVCKVCLQCLTLLNYKEEHSM